MNYDFSALTAYLESLKNEKGLPCGDAIVFYNGKQVYRHFIGSATNNTLYYMYSCTKPVTVVAAMQMVERGIIRLDDPVCKYFPSYAEAKYRSGEQLLPVGEKLTVKHLFTMSGGLNYNCESDAINHVKSSTPNASTIDIIPAFVKNTPLEFEPGTLFRYSLCLDVLAGVMEIASGVRFSEWLQNNIFGPLGMNEATLHLSKQKEHRLASPFHAKEGKLFPIETGIGSFQITSNYESGGAGLVCSTEDYGKFAAAMSCGGISLDGVRILKSETIDLIRTPQLTSKHNFECTAGPEYAYGYGVRTLVTNKSGAKSHIGEFGWDGAAGSYILMDPDAKVAIVYTQQVLGWGAHFGNIHAPMRDLSYQALKI